MRYFKHGTWIRAENTYAYILCIGLYNLTRNVTALPIAMTLERGILVLCLAVLMCVISGAIAVRKVQDADPADIF